MRNQIEYYENKLACEMDPCDLFNALNNILTNIRTGILAGLLFSVQVITGQETPANHCPVKTIHKIEQDDHGTESLPVIHYLYGCGLPEINQQLNCILLLVKGREYGTELLQPENEEIEEEALKIESWMLQPELWLNKQTAGEEQNQ